MDLLTLAIQGLYYVLFAAVVWRYLRQPDPLQLQVVAVFGCFAALFATSFVVALDPDLAGVVRPVAVVLLLAQPYLVLRIVDQFGTLPRWARLAALGAFIVSAGLFVGLGPRNLLALLVLVAYFVVTEAAAAAMLLLDSRRRYGFPRVRLVIAGLSVALFALAILVAGAAGTANVASGTTRPTDPLITAFSRLCALVAAVGFLAAFAPPRWLRRLAQRAIAFDLTRAVVATPTGADPARLWRELAAAAAEILGTARVWIRLADGSEPVHARLPDPGLDAEPGRDDPTGWAAPAPLVAPAVEVPLVSEGRRVGTLNAEVRGRALFVEDDLALLELLGSLTARAVDREVAIVRLAEADRELEESAAVRASEARFRALLEASPNAVLALDRAGRITWATRVATDLFGYAADELPGVPLDRLVDVPLPPGRAPGDDVIAESAQAGLRADTSGHRRDGTPFPAEVALAAFELDGEPFQIAVVSDVSWRHAADLMRERFLGVLSHELRTPITSIYGGTQLLLSRDGLDAATRLEFLTGVAAESERLQRLIENLLVLARVERGADFAEPRPMLLARVIPGILARERTSWPDVRIELSMDRSLPLVAADEEYLAQIMRNLLSNAAKYAGARSTVRVSIGTEDEGASIRIIDDGPGIAPEEAESLFGLYFRSSRVTALAPGAGIGLFVCRQLVEAMGGRIWARARPEGGSEFGFTIPAYLEEVEAEAPAMASPEARSPAKATGPMPAPASTNGATPGPVPETVPAPAQASTNGATPLTTAGVVSVPSMAAEPGLSAASAGPLSSEGSAAPA